MTSHENKQYYCIQTIYCILLIVTDSKDASGLKFFKFSSCQEHLTACFAKYICSVEGNSTGVLVSKVSTGIFVIKVTLMPIIFGETKLPFWVR